MARLSRADLEAVLDFAGEVNAVARDAQRADPMLLERIARLVGAEVVAYSQFDASEQLGQDTEYPGPATVPSEAEWELYRTQNPFTAYAGRTGDPFFPARRLTDVVDVRAFRQTELSELLDADVPHSIQMRMPGTSGSTWVFEVARGGRNYSTRDLLLLDALRPWLVAYEDHRVLHLMVARLSAAQVDGIAAADLSPRENEVMDLVAEGASNAQIAERLWISPGTVRKHLENIYLKLEVGSRTAALARTGRASIGTHRPAANAPGSLRP